MEKKVYFCIDLKSFYASVECVERGLDPLNVNLVVADPSRSRKTICLAVSPSLKKYGISGRARLFEVIQKVQEINEMRKKKNKNRKLVRKSYFDDELEKDFSLEVDFLIATPHMRKYIEYSRRIYEIYLQYVSFEDIFSYSIDEVFIDATPYLHTYRLRGRDFLTKIIQKVYEETHISATGGMGTNLYLAKVAMDILSKHVPPNREGVRIAGLDEILYRKKLWTYQPLSSFWRVGEKIQKRLEKYEIYTMGDIARVSLFNEEILYQEFGVMAEFLIDHAWGWESGTLKDIKTYQSRNRSISSSQILPRPYDHSKTRLIVREMADNLSLLLVRRCVFTSKISLSIQYDFLKNSSLSSHRAHGSVMLDHATSYSSLIREKTLELFDRIIDPDLFVRRVRISALSISSIPGSRLEQFSLFSDFLEEDVKNQEAEKREEEDLKLQKTILEIKGKYGKNSILKGMNLVEGGTMIERNKQIGGHKE